MPETDDEVGGADPPEESTPEKPVPEETASGDQSHVDDTDIDELSTHEVKPSPKGAVAAGSGTLSALAAVLAHSLEKHGFPADIANILIFGSPFLAVVLNHFGRDTLEGYFLYLDLEMDAFFWAELKDSCRVRLEDKFEAAQHAKLRKRYAKIGDAAEKSQLKILHGKDRAIQRVCFWFQRRQKRKDVRAASRV